MAITKREEAALELKALLQAYRMGFSAEFLNETYLKTIDAILEAVEEKYKLQDSYRFICPECKEIVKLEKP